MFEKKVFHLQARSIHEMLEEKTLFEESSRFKDKKYLKNRVNVPNPLYTHLRAFGGSALLCSCCTGKRFRSPIPSVICGSVYDGCTAVVFRCVGDPTRTWGFTLDWIVVYVFLGRSISELPYDVTGVGVADTTSEYVDKLKGIGQCFYPLLTWGSTGKLEPRDAFYLALEWMQLPPQANDKKLRVKVAQGMLSTAARTEARPQSCPV